MGGARAQLESVSERIRPDLNPGVKRTRTKEIPEETPVNAMAPPAKQRRRVCCVFFQFHISTETKIFIKGKHETANLLPTAEDPPLNLNAPKPSFANSHSRSAFGFQVVADPEDVGDQDVQMMDENAMDENANIATEGNNGGKLYF